MSRIATLVLTFVFSLNVIAPNWMAPQQAHAQAIVTVSNGSTLPAGTIAVWEIVRHGLPGSIRIYGGVLPTAFPVGTLGLEQHNAWSGYATAATATSEACIHAQRRRNDGQFASYQITWNDQGIPVTCPSTQTAPVAGYPPTGGYVPTAPYPPSPPPPQFVTAPAPPVAAPPPAPSGVMVDFLSFLGQPVAAPPPGQRYNEVTNFGLPPGTLAAPHVTIPDCAVGPQEVYPNTTLPAGSAAILRLVNWQEMRIWVWGVESLYSDTWIGPAPSRTDRLVVMDGWATACGSSWPTLHLEACKEATSLIRAGLVGRNFNVVYFNDEAMPTWICNDP